LKSVTYTTYLDCYYYTYSIFIKEIVYCQFFFIGTINSSDGCMNATCSNLLTLTKLEYNNQTETSEITNYSKKTMATRNLTKQFKTLRDGYSRRNNNNNNRSSTVTTSRTRGNNKYKAIDGSDPTVRLVDEVDLNDSSHNNNNNATTTTTTSSSAATLPDININTHQSSLDNTLIPQLPPKWVDDVFDVEQTIKEVDGKLAKLNDMYKNHVLMKFDEDERQREGDAAEALSRDITRKLKFAEQKIKRIGSSSESNTDAKVRLNVQRTLATRVQNLSLELRKAQKEHMIKIERQQNVKNNPVFVDDPLEAGYVDISRSDMVTLESSEQMVNARAAEIERLAKSIDELASIFKNLAVLVIEQGTILDRIDANMELVVEQTQKGIKELHQADNYSKSNMFFYCMTILVITILVLLGIETAKLT
jgi:syntaxin 16